LIRSDFVIQSRRFGIGGQTNDWHLSCRLCSPRNLRTGTTSIVARHHNRVPHPPQYAASAGKTHEQLGHSCDLIASGTF
jgi:hypothetical protein